MPIIKSFAHAIDGIVGLICTERNLRIHLIIMVCVIILGLMVGLTAFEWTICIILFGAVISAEIFNTVIEKTMNYINEDYDEDIRFIKDASAGAVLVMAIASAVIGLIIFIPKLV